MSRINRDDGPDEPWDDTHCAYCFRKLPDKIEPETAQWHGFCDDRCGKQTGILNSVADLASAVMAGDASEKSIARRLYKDTRCGISFCVVRENADGYLAVSVAGYCEGTERKFEGTTLQFPFWHEEFTAAVEAADAEGVEVWNQTHGCALCGTAGMGAEERINLAQHRAEMAEWAVDPECAGCGGGGEIR